MLRVEKLEERPGLFREDGLFLCGEKWGSFQLYRTLLIIFLSAKLNKSKRERHRQGRGTHWHYQSIITVGGSDADMGAHFIVNLFFWNANAVLWSSIPECHARSVWNAVCFRLSTVLFMLHSSCYKCIDFRRRGSLRMWLANWMGIGRDRGQKWMCLAYGSAC